MNIYTCVYIYIYVCLYTYICIHLGGPWSPNEGHILLFTGALPSYTGTNQGHQMNDYAHLPTNIVPTKLARLKLSGTFPMGLEIPPL